jgi:putative exporter of polyketide antibiotics
MRNLSISFVIRRDRFRFTFWLLAYVAGSWFPS